MDSAFGSANLISAYGAQEGWLLTPQQLPPNLDSWQHHLYAYRHEIIELLFQRITQTCDLKACPPKGLPAVERLIQDSVG